MNFQNTIFPSIEIEGVKDVDEFVHFCKMTVWTNDKTSANMNQLPALLSERFDGVSGQMFTMRASGKLIGCSGVYLSSFSNQVAILGCRSWLKKEFRNQSIIRDIALPEQKKWAIGGGAVNLALTFNLYNKNLRELFLRNIIKRKTRTEDMLFYKNVNVVDYPVIIQNTPQWAIYEKLSDWEFDWKLLK